MKIFRGEVVAFNPPSTAIVRVDRIAVHPVYGKRFKSSKKYHVHTTSELKVGEVVQFVESRPYSKTKRWRLVQVLKGTDKRRVKKNVGKK